LTIREMTEIQAVAERAVEARIRAIGVCRAGQEVGRLMQRTV